MNQIKPLSEQVADKLVAFIIENKYKNGEKLPNETELSKLLGVGRSTVREAVRILSSRHIVEVRQGAGTFIVENQMGISDDPLGFSFIEDKYKLVLDLIEVRLALEPRIAAMAATSATEEEIQQLGTLCQEVEDLINNNGDHLEKDILFHRKLAQSSNNIVVPTLMPIIQRSISLFVDITNSELKNETIETHRAIFNGIKNRDPLAASDAMMLHIIYNRNLLRNLFSA